MSRIRWVLAILVVAVALVAAGRLGAHVALCRHDRGGSSASAAVDSYYQWCLRKPARTPIYDGRKESTAYATWHDVRELTVTYGSTTKFLLVGQHDAGGRWHVLDGEGSGP